MSEKMMTVRDVAETGERLLGIHEVAARLRIHPKTLNRLLREHDARIPAPLKTIIGNGLRWRESAVNEHIRGLE